jgi:uncharacterized protein
MQAMSRAPFRSAASGGLVAVLVALVLALAPAPALARDPIPLRPVEEPTYGLATVIPETWTARGPGIYARVPDGSDHVGLAIESARVPVDYLWSSILPQLGRTEPPEPVGSRTTDAFTWDLYQLETDTPDGILRVDLGIAVGGGSTYLVLLQSPIAGADALREAVFLPAIDALAPLAPEPTPDPATLPYLVKEVSFPGGAPDVTLAGTLTVPRTAGPHPAIVLLSGNGPQDRDGSIRPLATIKPFALLADALSRAGLAVLSYDDRGTAASTGTFTTAGLADFTADAGAALAFLRDRPEVDPARVGVLGHSEGGVYIASLIEAGEPLAFAVGMAAPATNGVDVFVAQNGALVRSSGGSEEEAALAEAFAAKLYAAALGDDLAAAEAATREYFGGVWDRQPPDAQSALGDRGAFIDGQVAIQIAGVQAPSFIDILRSDAGVGWEAATFPVLGVFGGRDVQVLATQNAPLMEAQLAGSDPASRVVTLPDANHLLQAALTGGVAEYGTLDQAFTPAFLPLVTGWVAEQAGLARPIGATASPSASTSP